MSRSWMIRVLGAACLAMVWAAPARAQSGLVEGIVGSTNAATHDVMYAGRLGGRWVFFEVDAEYGRMQNILPQKVHDQLVTIDPTIDARVRANYGLVIVRLIPDAGIVRPFVAVGGGFAQLRPEVTPANLTGVTTTLFPTNNRTKGALDLEGGLEFAFDQKAFVDVAYRYFRICSDYHVTSPNSSTVLTNVNIFYGGLGFRF
jgi:opacity protein-like surface antigen